ncbi:hypothetical protein THIOM_003624 [Candidatus Thiomargarita nelsonii]|uniref:Uncharacterized protein n=1 Tax=Candidatus Thiomargarita nelsonii TaxID=1003181 RepID=A0A176RY86_9GAMM|nr:hypothetical protein THIOM_003624 [Candidatus Thiomargarita nelsonii]
MSRNYNPSYQLIVGYVVNSWSKLSAVVFVDDEGWRKASQPSGLNDKGIVAFVV